jgi:hypothetical protein
VLGLGGCTTVAIGCVGFVVLSQLSDDRRTVAKLLAVPPGFTLAIALFGTVFANPSGETNLRSAVGPFVILVLVLAQAAASAILVGRFETYRAFMITVSVLALLASLWASIMGYMSVTGDWL